MRKVEYLHYNHLKNEDCPHCALKSHKRVQELLKLYFCVCLRRNGNHEVLLEFIIMR